MPSSPCAMPSPAGSTPTWRCLRAPHTSRSCSASRSTGAWRSSGGPPIGVLRPPDRCREGSMRIAVIGGSGLVGRAVVGVLERDGHEGVTVSRSAGVNVISGDGLEAAVLGCHAVIDVLNPVENEGDAPRRFFTEATHSLLVAERAAGVPHHVVLSIVGVDRIRHNPHFVGKQHQERLARSGPIPATIVRATQFHDFAGMVASWTRNGDGTAFVPPLLVQPIDVGDVAETLVEVALGRPRGTAPLEVAGPEQHDLVD